MKDQNIPYQKQIFVCTNDQKGEKASCGDHKGEEIFRQLREIAKSRGLHPKIRIAQAKCLGQCSIGTNIMVYPDNVWHSHVQVSDVAGLADKYLKP